MESFLTNTSHVFDPSTWFMGVIIELRLWLKILLDDWGAMDFYAYIHAYDWQSQLVLMTIIASFDDILLESLSGPNPFFWITQVSGPTYAHLN